MKTYVVSKRFYQDFCSRFGQVGEVLSSNASSFKVNLTSEQYNDLIEDARFYADTKYVMQMMGSAYLGLSRSALSTVKSLEKVGA